MMNLNKKAKLSGARRLITHSLLLHSLFVEQKAGLRYSLACVLDWIQTCWALLNIHLWLLYGWEMSLVINLPLLFM